MSVEQNTESQALGAQGVTTSDGDPGKLLGDERYVKADTALLRRAIREGWGVSRETKEAAKARMDEIVRKKVVLTLTQNGPVENEAVADSNAIAAARVLTSMTGQDQADDHHEDDVKRGANEGAKVQTIVLVGAEQSRLLRPPEGT